MKICVVGSGYVGLVTGSCLADFGMQVTGVDKDADKVRVLQGGGVPIYEPGLQTLVAKNAAAGRLEFSTELGPAVEEAQAIFIAVGTPSLPDGSANLQFIEEVAAGIGEHLNGFKAIITKSTVPIGTGKLIESIIRERAGGQDFAVVSNPEFLREGSAIEDFMHPERVVVGTSDPRARDLMLDIYSPLRVADVPFILTSVESAELIKYASNGFLATKISFVNEVAQLAELLGADIEVVARGMGLDSRVGPKFLHPGPGFGGSCFPKDSRALGQIASDNGMTFRIIEAVMEVNERTKQRMVTKIRNAVGDLDGKTIAVLGIAFKPDTDDIRESPALTILDELHKAGATVRAFDPAAIEPCRALLPDIEYVSGAYEAVEGADAAVIVTEWNEFRALEPGRMGELMRQPLMIDLRNIYEPERMAEAGFDYISVGRPSGMGSSEAE